MPHNYGMSTYNGYCTTQPTALQILGFLPAPHVGENLNTGGSGSGSDDLEAMSCNLLSVRLPI